VAINENTKAVINQAVTLSFGKKSLIDMVLTPINIPLHNGKACQ
jgi:hypothetical protein